jgi:putative tricarboxylic transport membrane protein
MPLRRRRLPGELIFALLLIVLSLFLLWQAYGISGFESLTSAGAFPMVAAAVMLVTAVIAFRDTTQYPRVADESGDSLWQQFVRRVSPAVLVQFVICIAAYMLALEKIGFILSSYLFLLVSMWVLGSRKFVLNLWVSALCLAAVYLIFQTVFSVVLPSGSLLQGVLK